MRLSILPRKRNARRATAVHEAVQREGWPPLRYRTLCGRLVHQDHYAEVRRNPVSCKPCLRVLSRRERRERIKAEGRASAHGAATPIASEQPSFVPTPPPFYFFRGDPR